MTLDEALNLAKGDVVTHAATVPRHRPIKVLAVWWNDARTIVRIRCASIGSQDVWHDPLTFELPPAKKVWNDQQCAWTVPPPKKGRHETIGPPF